MGRFFSRQDDARRRMRRLLWAFALTVLLLVIVLNAALGTAWWLFTAGGRLGGYPAGFFEVNTGLILCYVLGGWWLESSDLKRGGARLAQRAGARQARRDDNAQEQRFCNVVDELAIAAGMKPPAPMVLPRVEAINAFAAGWDESDAVLVATQGALKRLTREELQGLVAHELSHIHEGDTRLNMRLAGMAGGLQMLRDLGQAMTGSTAARLMPRVGIFIVLAGGLIRAAGWAGWLAGEALKAAVSRQREYLADARAVQWTRSRDGIGGVLRKILHQQNELAAQNPPIRPRSIYVAEGEADLEAPVTWDTGVQHMLLSRYDLEQRHWFDSHPPLKERIRRIYGRPMPALPN
jgi:Zn-dependent protease with chaperone function